jgi:hypothetical protein
MKREEMVNYILKHDNNYSLMQLHSFSDVHIKAIYIVTFANINEGKKPDPLPKSKRRKNH